MAETREGGVYRVGDEWHNANGDKVDAPTAEEEWGTETRTESPSDDSRAEYPYADLLRENGFADWRAVQAASDDDLLAVDGIGPRRVQEIRAHKG